MSDSMNEHRDRFAFLDDEQGHRSMARLALVAELVYVWLLGLLDISPRIEVPGPVWVLHGSLIIALIAWAGGPRGLQYLGPQVAKTGAAVATAVKRAMARKTPEDIEP